MKVRYYADEEIGEMHEYAIRLLRQIHDEHDISVEIDRIEPHHGAITDFPGEVRHSTPEEVYERDLKRNRDLNEAIEQTPSEAFKHYGKLDIAGNVAIVDEGADSALAYPPEELAPVAPPDYILPTQQEPLDSIEDRTDLPPAGELLYNILHNIEWIWLSPMAELTNRRQLVADIKTLCDEHGYSPQALVASPIRTAQERGDFPGES